METRNAAQIIADLIPSLDTAELVVLRELMLKAQWKIEAETKSKLGIK